MRKRLTKKGPDPFQEDEPDCPVCVEEHRSVVRHFASSSSSLHTLHLDTGYWGDLSLDIYIDMYMYICFVVAGLRVQQNDKIVYVYPSMWLRQKDGTRMLYKVGASVENHPNPEGKDLWLRVDSGHTQYSSLFIAEVESATVHVDDEKQALRGEVSEPSNIIIRTEVVDFTPPQDQPAQARDALTKTVPKARIIPNKVVMNTTGAQYERWKRATAKELQAFLKTAWKEPTPELLARYFAAKKKIVMQVLVFNLMPMTAEKKAMGLLGDEFEKARICFSSCSSEPQACSGGL